MADPRPHAAIDIPDLLAEIDAWTGFTHWFTHLRTGDRVRLAPALLTAILGDATNLGAKRMADASAGVSERQILWARLFHIRPETYKSALAAIINAHLAHPHARLWGNGTTSSSDGQFLRAAGRGAKRSEVNAHYSGDPGSKFYTWVSDQHGHFHILPMGATEDEAVYVLDGLYGHESRIDIEEHYVDTGGASDHLFSLFTLGESASHRGCAISRTGACTPLRPQRPTRPSSITSASGSMSPQSARAGTRRCASASRSRTASSPPRPSSRSSPPCRRRTWCRARCVRLAGSSAPCS